MGLEEISNSETPFQLQLLICQKLFRQGLLDLNAVFTAELAENAGNKRI